MTGPIYYPGRTSLTSGLGGGDALQPALLVGELPPQPGGVQVYPTRGAGTFSGQPIPKIESLTDDFATQDNAKWMYAGTASVSAGQLQLVPTSGYANKVISTGTFDLTGSAVTVQLVSAPLGNGTIGSFVKAIAQVNVNEVWFLVEGGVLYMGETVNSSQSTTSVTYSATDHLWLRIRHDGTSLLWETSPDATAWTTRRTKAPGRSWDAVNLHLFSGFYGTEPTPGVSVFDNVNVTGASASPAA